MSNSNVPKKILFIGQVPETVDFSDPALPPGTDAAKIHTGIKAGMQQMVDRGWNADLCLILPDETGLTQLRQQFAGNAYDCVVIGGGIRIPPKSLALFEAIVNVVHRAAPQAAIAFNTTPQDTATAASRWVAT